MKHKLLLRYAVVIIAAYMMRYLAPPVNLHWLHWFIYVPVLWALQESSPRENKRLAFVYGTVALGSIFSWLIDTMTIFSNLPLVATLGVWLLFAIAFGLPYLLLWPMVHRLRRGLGVWWILAFPCLQVVLEFLTMYIFLFPYHLGATQYRQPEIWQLVSITGTSGMTWLIFFCNGILAETVYRWREGNKTVPWKPALLFLVLIMTTYSWGSWRYQSIEQQLSNAPVLNIAQIQSTANMEERLSSGPRTAFDEWKQRTERLPQGESDLVVWPEGACPYSLNEGKAREILQDISTSGQFHLLAGGGTRLRIADASMGESKVRVYNSVYHFDPENGPQGHYDKLVPLPFGEYLPFAEQLPWLADLIEGPGSFRAGTEAVVFDVNGIRIATPICYEAILGYLVRRFDRPDLIVNVTNDAWFGNTAASHQHGMLAASRATEFGIPLFRSAYSGVSMVVEPHGRITGETPLFTEVHRVLPVRIQTIPTFYARFGDWFTGLCAAVLAYFWFGFFRRRREL